MPIEIRRLTPELLPDYLAFFDNDAFADNPEWAGCYCVYYHASDEDWQYKPGEGEDAGTGGRARKHRVVAQSLIPARQMAGFLAYANGKVAGWCNAAPREAYQNPRVYGKARDATPRVGAIMCFVVAQSFRRTGVASALLAAVCDAFVADDLDIVEAYPSLDPGGGPTDAGGLYHGPLEMYLKAGFETIRRFDSFTVVRKALTPAE